MDIWFSTRWLGMKLWDRIEELCWEGFDKFRKHAYKNYPSDSHNKSMNTMMTSFKGSYKEWCTLVDQITEIKGD